MGQIIFANADKTEFAPERGFKPGNSYAISDIETISLQSGNLMLHLPLAALPAGRGGMSASLSLLYNSKIWNVSSGDAPQSGSMSLLTPSEEGGWRYGYRYEIKLQDADPNYVPNLIMPDGSQHKLCVVDSNGNPDCKYTTYTNNTYVDYFTVDGTYLKIRVQANGGTDPMNMTWTLSMPDGSLVINKPDGDTAQRIIDKNGNPIDIIENGSDSNYGGHRTTYIKDDVNRKIVIEYSHSNNVDYIHFKGFGGADMVTRVFWTTVTVKKSYKACPGSCLPLEVMHTNLNQTLPMVAQVYLPEPNDGVFNTYGNLSYSFDYNDDIVANSSPEATVGWGELKQVTTPTGAYSNYEYSSDNHTGGTVIAEAIAKNHPVTKTLNYEENYDNSTASKTDTWSYGSSVCGSYNCYTITDPTGAVTTQAYGAISNYASDGGEVLMKTVNPDGSIIEKYYQPNNPIAPSSLIGSVNNYPKYEYTTITDNTGNPSETAIKEYSIDKNGNTTEVKEYNFVSYSSVHSSGNPIWSTSGLTPARIKQTEYYNPVPEASTTTYNDGDSYHLATSSRLRSLPKAVEVLDSSSTPKSRSEMTYDYTNYSSNTKGGNLIETKNWDSFKGGSTRAYSNPLTSTNSISTSATYDPYGNPTQTTDANNVQTTITYGSINGYTGLYPTQTEVASNYSTLKRTTTTAYDFSTGLPTSVTDVDNSVTGTTDYDKLGRPVKTAAAYGTALEVWTQTFYNDTNRRVTVKSDLETKGDAKKVATKFYDQLGRVRLVKTLEDAAAQSATNETDGIKVQTRYKTASGYSYQLTSNPYRADYSNNAGSETTMGWTLSKSVNTGRHSEVETFEGAALPQPFASSGYNTNSTGKVQTDLDGDRTLVTDQAGKQRISKSNALGQLTDVWEVKGSDSDTEAITFAGTSLYGLKTSYLYDTLNNLSTVTQGGQTRSFSYSTLSKLLSASNPESGTISYIYDANGNLTSKKDARNITTTYSYDALNRVTQRSYDDSVTPAVNYTYDDVTHAKGKLTKVSSAISETRYTAFDLLGRVTSSEQRTPFSSSETISTATPRVSTYSYNLSGALIEQTYPSGRVVKNVLDSNGDLSMVQSKKNSSYGYWNYAQNFTYNAAGAVTSMQLGNFKWESTVFNSRLQPTQIALGTTQAAYDILKLNYAYNSSGQSDNTGNILSQTITVPTVGGNSGFTAVQTYSYDSLNRIHDAKENIDGSSMPEWKQTFTYDRFGNRNFDEANTTANSVSFPKTCGTSPNFIMCAADKKIFNPAIDTSNNRLSTSDGYSFDASGNMTKDAQLRKFTYDAENKQIKVETVNSGGTVTGTVGEYNYDGDGKRIKKVVPGGETTIFVYDASGKMVAEYSTVPAATPQVNYLTSDNLESPRINTNENGAVTARHDYQPFGEEIATSQRIAGLAYNSDEIRKKFTSYERDTETNLDFAQARVYQDSQGRFTTPDPLLTSGVIENPQTWNRFVYVLNNPLVLIDSTGMFVWSDALGGYDTDADIEKKIQTAKKKNDVEEAIRLQTILDRRISITNAMYEARMSLLMGADIGTAEDAEILRQALDAYGTPGIDNGVTVGLATDQTPGYNSFGGVTVIQGERVVVGFPDYVLANSSIGQEADPFLFAYVAHEGVHILQAKKWLEYDPFRICGDSDFYDPSNYEAEITGYMAMTTAIRGNNKFKDQSGILPSPNAAIWRASWMGVDENIIKANISEGIRKHLQNLDITPQNAVPAFPGKAVIK